MTSMANIRVPEEFEFNKPESWPKWIKRFGRYISVTELVKKSDKDKIDLLYYRMGEKSEEILLQVMPNITEANTFIEVKEILNLYFAPKKNVVFERYKFNARVQEQGESIDSLVTALYSLAESCEYGAIKDELIRDRIVIGICNKSASERLAHMNDLTLEKAFELVRQSEIQTKEGIRIRQEADGELEANRVSQKEINTHRQRYRGNKDNKGTSRQKE